jgi:hypothetical protein
MLVLNLHISVSSIMESVIAEIRLILALDLHLTRETAISSALEINTNIVAPGTDSTCTRRVPHQGTARLELQLPRQHLRLLV